MKVKKIATIAVIGTLTIGIGILGLFEMRNKPDIPRYKAQHPVVAPDNGSPIPISKSTTLILLAVGIIGVLCVRRKKKAGKSPAQQKKSQTIPGDRDKVFIDLNKQYLNLQYKITQHQFSGDSPPDGLLRAFSDVERKIRLISRALE